MMQRNAGLTVEGLSKIIGFACQPLLILEIRNIRNAETVPIQPGPKSAPLHPDCPPEGGGHGQCPGVSPGPNLGASRASPAGCRRRESRQPPPGLLRQLRQFWEVEGEAGLIDCCLFELQRLVRHCSFQLGIAPLRSAFNTVGSQTVVDKDHSMPGRQCKPKQLHATRTGPCVPRAPAPLPVAVRTLHESANGCLPHRHTGLNCD